MARKQNIVWSKYLSERTILRAWFILENNYFKKAIRKTNVETESNANYGKCHNALYSGLYFSEYPCDSSFKPIPAIKKLKGTNLSGTIANFVPPYEILQNIHAMNLAGRNILKFLKDASFRRTFGNNNEAIYLISNEAGKVISKIKIDNNKVNNDQNALTPIQPSCYKYVKKIKEHLKLGKSIGTVYSEGVNFKREKFEKAVENYKKEKNQFVLTLANFGVFGEKNVDKIMASLDNGLYQTMVGDLGFSFDKIMDKTPLQDFVSRKEIELHTKKLSLAVESLKKSKVNTVGDITELFYEVANDLRNEYIITNKVYPECNKGFYNVFADMLAMNFENIELSNSNVKNYPQVLDELSKQMAEIKAKYEQSRDDDYKKQVQDAINEISEKLKSL